MKAAGHRFGGGLLKHVGDEVRLRALWWEGPLPEVNDRLVTSTGRQYLIERVGKQRPTGAFSLFCRVMPSDAPHDFGVAFRWVWSRKTTRRPKAFGATTSTRESDMTKKTFPPARSRMTITDARGGKIKHVVVESYDQALELIAPRCTVGDCGDKPLAKGLCQKHYGRARRGQPLEVEPRRGLVQLVIHVDPGLKRWLKKTARRDKVSVSQRASTLLQSEMDNLSGKNPF